MAAKLFKLRSVPDDEAEDIRQLLLQHEMAFYETKAGGWGISVPAIWLHDQAQLESAKVLIADYQQQRVQQARAEYHRQKEQGQHSTVVGNIRQKPAQFVLLVLAVLFILYVSLAPFVDFLQ
ncbi:MAG: hypothetical protein JKY87_08090 [Mariprofundus sp.]|nr:hypothetical protein [Mariprofundus sp.]